MFLSKAQQSFCYTHLEIKEKNSIKLIRNQLNICGGCH